MKIPVETFPYEAIVFDAGYGEIREFLRSLDEQGKTFVAQIPESHSFWPIDVPINNKQPKTGRRRRYEEVADKKLKPLSAKQWRIKLLAKSCSWKTVKLSLASKKTVQVMAIRLRETITQAFYRPGKERWLIIEKFGENSYKYYASNASVNIPLKQIVLWAHERWKVEQG